MTTQEGASYRNVFAVAYNFMFTQALKRVRTKADFVPGEKWHRREVAQDLRRQGVPKGRIDGYVVAVRKRVSVWKDAMKSVKRMASHERASWTDGYKAMLYRRIEPVVDAKKP